MQHFGWAEKWYGKANREEHARPVADLRETARQLGLVRVYRGEVRPTTVGRRLADDPEGLWHHVAAHLPLARNEPEHQAALLWLIAVAARATQADQLVIRGMWALGWAMGEAGKALDKHEAFAAYRDTWVVFEMLGIAGDSWRNEMPSAAGVDLARAALVREPEAPRRTAKVVPALRLTVTLREVEPPVWRSIVVPESLSLRQLHGVLQAAMGWTNSHLYRFDVAGVSYAQAEDVAEGIADADAAVQLRSVLEVGDSFVYEYDFGDGWEHDIRVDGRDTAAGAHCLDGARACPPEDCGGPGGYENVLEAQADRGHPEHAAITEWLGAPFDPAAFDLDDADRQVQRALSARARGRH
jgi:hypothetical protein